MKRTPVGDRRTELIAAAVRVIGARGLSGASTRAIVAEAGMSLASFHYAFTSRDELLDLLIKEVLVREETAVLPAELTGRTLQELLEAGLMGYLDHLRAEPHREQAMMELTQLALRSRQSMAQDQYAEYARIAVASLDLAAQHAGVHWRQPVGTVARLLVALTDGLTISWLVDRDDAAAEGLVRVAAESIAGLSVESAAEEGMSPDRETPCKEPQSDC